VLTNAVRLFYLLTQNLALTGLHLARHFWATDPTAAAVELLPVVTQLQAIAAHQALAANTASLAEQGTPIEREWLPYADSVPGWSNNGILLADVLTYPNWFRTRLLERGYQPEVADRMGLTSLERITTTNITDAATDIAVIDAAARPRVGYVRVVGADACANCILLAGRFYWVEGFQRHPNCACTHQLAAWSNADQAQKWAIEQQTAAFDRLTPEQQDKKFGKDAAEAIRQGGDIGQVLNERRGRKYGGTYERAGAYTYDPMRGTYHFDPNGTTTVRTRPSATTREGMRGVGGYAQQVRGGLARQTIPSLVSQSGGDRDVLKGLLREHGYIVERDTNGRLKIPEFNLAPTYQRTSPTVNLADTPLGKAIAAIGIKR